MFLAGNANLMSLNYYLDKCTSVAKTPKILSKELKQVHSGSFFVWTVQSSLGKFSENFMEKINQCIRIKPEMKKQNSWLISISDKCFYPHIIPIEFKLIIQLTSFKAFKHFSCNC